MKKLRKAIKILDTPFKALRRITKERKKKKYIQIRDEAIIKYRQFDDYVPDLIKYDAQTIHIEKKLPSEPPNGITYKFGATGYFTKDKDPEYCVIYTEWKNVNNYCHWTLAELPLIHLALESDAKNIVIPQVLLKSREAFQKRWWEVLQKKFSHKNIIPLSKLPKNVNGIIPVNHDSSASQAMVGKCEYKLYHSSRATPYALDFFSKIIDEFIVDPKLQLPKFYINRKNRRLENESDVQKFVLSLGFKIINLEDFTLDQQVQLFSQAEFIIGFHGAGLVNTVFSPANTQIIEIVDKSCVHPSYIDGVHLPGRKANRTYFHMIGHMKNLKYSCIESQEYHLNVESLGEMISELQP